MTHLIDKDVVVAEIEERIKKLQDTYTKFAEKSNVTAMFLVGNCIKECNSILSFINSLEIKNVENFTDPLMTKDKNFQSEINISEDDYFRHYLWE